MDSYRQCVDCDEEGVAGFQSAWVCLMHFKVRVESARKTLEGLAKLRAREVVRCTR